MVVRQQEGWEISKQALRGETRRPMSSIVLARVDQGFFLARICFLLRSSSSPRPSPVVRVRFFTF